MATVIQTSARRAALNVPGTCRLIPALRKRVHIKWEAVVNFLVPVGYQDGTGFHYGTPPTSREAEQLLAMADF